MPAGASAGTPLAARRCREGMGSIAIQRSRSIELARFANPTGLLSSGENLYQESPASGEPDRPEHYQEVTWSLAERDGRSVLTVAETNLPSQEAKEISEQSWKAVLNNLKELLET